MSCPLPTLHGCECAHQLFAGRLAQLAPSRCLSGHWLDPRAIADPFLYHSHGMARIEVRGRSSQCGPWPGILTRRGWLELARHLDAAAADPGVEWISLELWTVVQQVHGFGDAMRALLRTRRVKRVTAVVKAAGGLAVPLASACHLVTSTPEAPFGWLDWGTFDGAPDSGARHRVHGMTNLLESRRVLRRFGYDNLPALRCGSIHGEQLEGRGVDWLDATEN